MPQSKQESPPREGASLLDRFRDLTFELKCDDDAVAFDEKLMRLAKAPKIVLPADNGDQK